jgi:hypothetical protein
MFTVCYTCAPALTCCLHSLCVLEVPKCEGERHVIAHRCESQACIETNAELRMQGETARRNQALEAGETLDVPQPRMI